jgi:hypothetical protein
MRNADGDKKIETRKVEILTSATVLINWLDATGCGFVAAMLDSRLF